VSGGWQVERATGSAADFHARDLPADPVRTVSVLEVDRPALVLGSTQPAADVDGEALRAAGVELVRRHSGGGAVLLVPGESLWVEAVLPRGDPLWDEDVGRSFGWLGRVWVEALADLGVDARAHAGPLSCTAWSRRVCFGGVGSGEVTVEGRKAVGIAQRRRRPGARFQCALLRRWSAGEVVALLALPPEERAQAAADLDAAAVGLDLDPDRVVERLLARFP
jgi:lipoate---protein ligase